MFTDMQYFCAIIINHDDGLSYNDLSQSLAAFAMFIIIIYYGILTSLTFCIYLHMMYTPLYQFVY